MKNAFRCNPLEAFFFFWSKWLKPYGIISHYDEKILKISMERKKYSMFFCKVIRYTINVNKYTQSVPKKRR